MIITKTTFQNSVLAVLSIALVISLVSYIHFLVPLHLCCSDPSLYRYFKSVSSQSLLSHQFSLFCSENSSVQFQ